MDEKVRKVLGGMSVAGLILAGSIPLMGQTGGSTGGQTTAKEVKKPTKTATEPKTPAVKDAKVKGDKDGKPADKANVKDTKGKGGCGSTKKAPTETKK